jgi:hypothetical protein
MLYFISVVTAPVAMSSQLRPAAPKSSVQKELSVTTRAPAVLLLGSSTDA